MSYGDAFVFAAFFWWLGWHLAGQKPAGWALKQQAPALETMADIEVGMAMVNGGSYVQDQHAVVDIIPCSEHEDEGGWIAVDDGKVITPCDYCKGRED